MITDVRWRTPVEVIGPALCRSAWIALSPNAVSGSCRDVSTLKRRRRKYRWRGLLEHEGKEQKAKLGRTQPGKLQNGVTRQGKEMDIDMWGFPDPRIMPGNM